MVNWPRGTVVFLFTDIEGSTVLWQQDRRATAAVVARHLRLLREAIEAHSGVHYKTIGDAVQAAFHTVSDALAAAVIGQQAILSEPWPPELDPIQVRMAIHVGSAEPVDGDYLAPALNRLSRVLASGHGGQILVTEAVRQLAGRDLPDGARFTSLGVHRFRDLVEPEEVFQLDEPGLPHDFPALRSLALHPTNLPEPAAPLLGRDADLATVLALFRNQTARLVTLTGPGGTGKTRLAIEIARTLRQDYPDGVFLVDLAPVTDPALVLPTIASVLNIREQSDQAWSETLAAYLATRTILLLLDNCEQILAVGPELAALLMACPMIAILATSREPFHLRPEQEYPVLPLSLPDVDAISPAELSSVPAVALFVARASAADPHFTLSEANASAVAEICRRLDGLPLAIELAAARVRILPPPALLERLERRLPMLTRGGRDLPARQQTMRDAIAWSYDLLDATDRHLFEYVSVFPDTFSFEAAEFIMTAQPEAPNDQLVNAKTGLPPSPLAETGLRATGSSLDVLDCLESLVAKSLVVSLEASSGDARYTMLGTIREFGLERLTAAGDGLQARSRLAMWALALAERTAAGLARAPDDVWFAHLERDQPTLRAGLAFFAEQGAAPSLARLSGALRPFWQEHAHYTEGLQWMKQALAESDDLPDDLRLLIIWGTGNLAWYQGELPLSRQMFEQAIVLAQKLGDRGAEAFILGSLASHDSEMGDDERAEARFEASRAIAADIGEPIPIAFALHNLAHLKWQQGRREDAARLLRDALAVAKTHNVMSIMPSVLVGLGTISTDLGDAAAALDYFRESIALGEKRGNLDDLSSSIGGIARLAASIHRPDDATRLFAAADAIRERLHVPVMPDEREEREAILSGPRTALGDERFQTLWNEGLSLSSEQAIDLALAFRLDIAANQNEPEIASQGDTPANSG
ncbi:MAG: tetratricopeptide repeat protein [Thermomicrobiales bacterium]